MNDKDFSITINAYFIVKWQDHRLLVTNRNRTHRSGSDPGSTTPRPVERSRPTPLPVYQTQDGFVKSGMAQGGVGAAGATTTRPLDPKLTIHATAEGDEDPTKLTAVNLQILRQSCRQNRFNYSGVLL